MRRVFAVIAALMIVCSGVAICQSEAAESQTYWVNPTGGQYYHWIHHCPSIHQRYYDGMIEISEEQLAQGPYNLLKPCNICRGMAEQEPADSGSNLGNAWGDSSIKDRVIQRAKDYLTETYGYTEDEASQFVFLFHESGELQFWPDESHSAYCYTLTFDPATGETLNVETPFYNGSFVNYPGEGNIRNVTRAFVENDWLHHWDENSVAAFSQKVYEWGEILPTQTLAEGLRSGNISSADAIRELFLSCFGPEETWTNATSVWLKELLGETPETASVSSTGRKTASHTKDEQFDIELKNGSHCAVSYYLETIPEETNLARFTEKGWRLKEGILADFILPENNGKNDDMQDTFDRGFFVLEKDGQRMGITLIRKNGLWESHSVGPCILSDRNFTMTLQTGGVDLTFHIEYESKDRKIVTCNCYVDGEAFIHLDNYSITDESSGDRFLLYSEGSGKWFWLSNQSGQEDTGGGNPRYVSNIYAMMHFAELPDSPESYEEWNRFPYPDGYYAVANVHLREKTSSRSKDMGLLNSGTVIHKTGEADGDPFTWYEAELGFLKGYVASQYVCVDDAGIATGDVYEPLPVAEAIRKADLKSGTGWFDGKITDVPEGTRMHVLFERDGWYYVVIPQGDFDFYMDVEGIYGFIPKDTVRTGNTGYDLDWP